MVDWGEKPVALFTVQDVFLKSIEISRANQITRPLQLELFTEIKVRDQKRPELLQVDLKLSSIKESAVMVQMELVGLFNLREGEEPPDKQAVHHFVLTSGVYSLWTAMNHMLKSVTTHMGMNSISVQMAGPFLPVISSEEEE